MNTNPDEAKLALWLDGELRGVELAEFETALRARGDYQELLNQKDDLERWKSMVASAVPASEEPPYPDFFNSRIEAAIQAGRPAVPARDLGFWWRRWFMPVAACAGMAMAFWLGARSQSRPAEIDVAGAPKAIPVEPVLYTPESGVEAEFIAGRGDGSPVIVLGGLDAIPDEKEFSATAGVYPKDEEESMAGLDVDPNQEGGL